MKENILIIIGALFYISPIPYIFYKRGNNKFLFVSATIGAALLTEVILIVIALPLVWALNYIVPELWHYGINESTSFVLRASSFVNKYDYVLLPFLNIFLSVILYRKYEIFRKTT